MEKCVSAPSAQISSSKYYPYQSPCSNMDIIGMFACLRVTIQSICARNIPEAAKKVFPTQKNKTIFCMQK